MNRNNQQKGPSVLLYPMEPEAVRKTIISTAGNSGKSTALRLSKSMSMDVSPTAMYFLDERHYSKIKTRKLYAGNGRSGICCE